MFGRFASLIALLVVAAACSQNENSATGESTVGSVATTTTTMGSTTVPTTVALAPTQSDSSQSETDRIIQAWIDGWLADDPDAVIVLYSDDGIYADDAYPFEYDVAYLVREHMDSTTYTVADRLNVIYSNAGATVDWLWAGTHWGSKFSMNATTTFEIQHGKIVRSTDSYVRCTAPWTGSCYTPTAGRQIQGTWHDSTTGVYLAYDEDGQYQVLDPETDEPFEWGGYTFDGETLTQTTATDSQVCPGTSVTWTVVFTDDGDVAELTFVEDSCVPASRAQNLTLFRDSL